MIDISALPSVDNLPPTPAASGKTLTVDQLGHLRHFDNISRLPPNDWSGMLQRLYSQDDGGTIRYQIGYISFALMLAHLHRLPAAPGLFKPIFLRLIEKILSPAVWSYWRDVSRAGGLLNSHLKLEEEWNPVGRDNVMYSGYIHSMVEMFGYLFDDHRFAEPESIVFEHTAAFWGPAEHRFAYDRDSLNEHMYWQLVQNGYMGIACQPNCLFQSCIQPPILGFRLHDLVTGTSRAEEATKGYQRAWDELGQIDDGGHFTTFVQADSKQVVPVGDLLLDAWVGALMNMWSPQIVRERYPDLIKEYVYKTADGTLACLSTPNPPGLEDFETQPQGWITVWASEMGDQSTLDGLLAYADAHLNPSWRDGGLYYPRHDKSHDKDGNPVLVDPLAGNALFGYARLNIPDGLWRAYNEPLSPGHHKDPAITGVARDVDISQAVFDKGSGTLTFTLRHRTDLPCGDEDELESGTVEIGRLSGHGTWSLHHDGKTIKSGEHEDSFLLRCPDTATTYTLTIDKGRPNA